MMLAVKRQAKGKIIGGYNIQSKLEEDINDNRSDEAIVITNEFGHKKKAAVKC